MSKKTKKLTYLGAGICMITLFSGCTALDFIKSRIGGNSTHKSSTHAHKTCGHNHEKHAEHASNNDLVLLKINGDSVLHKSEFDKYLMQMVQSNPYFRNMSIDALPNAIKRKVFDRLVDQRLIVHKAKQMKIEQTAEFKKSFAQTRDLLHNSLLVQLYEKNILDTVNVEDGDIKREFENNKEKYVKVAGGPLLEGIKFSDENAAQVFFDKVHKNFTSFTENARAEKGGEYQNFGRLSEDPRAIASMGISEEVRNVAFNQKDLPSIKKVVDGDDIWVIAVSDRKETIYFELDEIKSQLEMIVKANKFRGRLDDKLKELRGEFTIDINEEFFKDAQEEKVPQVPTKVTRLSVDDLPIKKINNADSSDHLHDQNKSEAPSHKATSQAVIV